MSDIFIGATEEEIIENFRRIRLFMSDITSERIIALENKVAALEKKLEEKDDLG